MTSDPGHTDSTRALALGWAAFVACSWTWCIGMYLPVLMVRDYGTVAWLVFALPNILGAAALGWVLHQPGKAARLSRSHWPAAVGFSVVTVLFHAFFVGWVIRSLVGEAAEIVTLTAAAGIFFYGRHGRRDLWIAAVLLGISLIAFIVAASLPVRHPLEPVGMKSMQGLWYLAPVCVFGFLLCPYLDLTFLRARASTNPNAGIAAFTLGFGIFFAAMITFTLWYARIVQPSGLHAVPRSLAWIIGGHMMLQSAFTIAVHSRAVSEDRRLRKPQWALAFVVGIVIAFWVGAWNESLLPRGYNTGETVYRMFMGFYGLVFPAYVWLCMIPTGGKMAVSGRFRMALLGIVMVVAGPMFWLGFIENRMIWLAPGLGVVLISRLALQLPGYIGFTESRAGMKLKSGQCVDK